jgi:hypothetical protein
LAAAWVGPSLLLSEIAASRGGEGAGLSCGDRAARRRTRGEHRFFKPSLVLLGGRVIVAGEVLLAAVREGVYRRSLSLAIRDLRISLSSLTPDPGLRVPAYLVLDELFSR